MPPVPAHWRRDHNCACARQRHPEEAQPRDLGAGARPERRGVPAGCGGRDLPGPVRPDGALLGREGEAEAGVAPAARRPADGRERHRLPGSHRGGQGAEGLEPAGEPAQPAGASPDAEESGAAGPLGIEE